MERTEISTFGFLDVAMPFFFPRVPTHGPPSDTTLPLARFPPSFDPLTVKRHGT